MVCLAKILPNDDLSGQVSKYCENCRKISLTVDTLIQRIIPQSSASDTICSARVPVLVRVPGVCRRLGARGPGAGGPGPGGGAEGGALPDEELHRDAAPGLRVETQTSITHPVTCCYFNIIFPSLYNRENISFRVYQIKINLSRI